MENFIFCAVIHPYSATFRTLCIASICRTLTYLESWNIQDPSKIASQCILKILSYLQKQVSLCNPGNSKPCHIGNSKILRTLVYLKSDTYSERSQGFKRQCFGKTVKSYKYFTLILNTFQQNLKKHMFFDYKILLLKE